MRVKKILLILFAALLFNCGAVTAQDVVYTQFYANPVYLNPALAGNKLVPRITLNYRNEWPSIGKGFVSYSACYDAFFDKLSGGLAIQANADMTQTLESFSGSVSYAYQLQISRAWSGALALQAGYFQYKLNWDKLIFEDQIITGEPTKEIQPERLSLGSVDFSSGVVLGYNQRLFFGGAVSHLTRPDIAFYNANVNRLPMRFTAHAGAIFSLKEGLQGERKEASLAPNIVFLKQGEFHQLNLGLYATLYPFIVGLWHRNNFENPDALIFLVGFEQTNFKIGYSYDLTVSKLSPRSGGSHEISFAWMLQPMVREIRYKAIKSPSF